MLQPSSTLGTNQSVRPRYAQPRAFASSASSSSRRSSSQSSSSSSSSSSEVSSMQMARRREDHSKDKLAGGLPSICSKAGAWVVHLEKLDGCPGLVFDRRVDVVRVAGGKRHPGPLTRLLLEEMLDFRSKPSLIVPLFARDDDRWVLSSVLKDVTPGNFLFESIQALGPTLEAAERERLREARDGCRKPVNRRPSCQARHRVRHPIAR